MKAALAFAVALVVITWTTCQATASERMLVLQAPPAASVDSVAVSPDGSLVATAAGEGGVRLYDARSGAFLRTIGDAGDRGVRFSPDGKTLTAAGFHMDKLVGMFDVQTGKRVLALAGQTEWEAYANALSPDGKLLASAGADKQVLVWELATGKLRPQLANQPYVVSALAFSPDSSTLASGSGDKIVKLWDATTGKLRRSLEGQQGWICSLAFSPNGQTIVSGSCDWGFHRGHDWPRPGGNESEQSEWRIWDVDSGKTLRTQSHSGRMLSLGFSPDGKSLACSVDKNLLLFDRSSMAPGRVVTTHTATITSTAFTPDGSAVITGSHDQTAKRTNLETGKTEWQAPGYFEQVNSVALSPDASLLVTGSSDHRFARLKINAGHEAIGPGAIRLWDARTGRMLRRFGDPSEQIMAVAISRDGRRIAAGGGTASGNGVVRVWESASGKEAWSHTDHSREVLAVAFAPDGSSLASAGADEQVKIRDGHTGSVVQTLADHRGGATSLVFSPDGKMLYCGEGHGGTRVWEVPSGRLLHSLAPGRTDAASFGGDRLINSIGLTRDGSSLATCNSSINNEFVDRVRIWDARTGKLTRDFEAEKTHGRPMAISPDGAIIATGGKAISLVDAHNGKPLRKLYGHLKRTQSIVFSADGRLIVSGGSYGTTNLWEIASGRHLVTLFAFSDDWLAYTSDGYYDCSSDGERYLAWRDGDDFVTPKTLGSQLRSPAKVEAALKLP